MTSTPDLRQAATAPGTGDVLRLCPTVLFADQKSSACMNVNRTQLMPGCGAIFDQGTKTVIR